MKKILMLIKNLDDCEKYKKVGITNFLFAIEEFSIGYKTFKLDQIPYDSYLYINRILDNEDIDNIKKIKNDLLKFKGIIFEDLGIYQIFKDEDIELIWNQNHFASSSSSINYWLGKIKSAVISNELTENEINNIINNSIKPVIFNVFGKNMVMYSRRPLLTNYNMYNNLENYNEAEIDENISQNKFIIKEYNKGTVIFTKEYFNYQKVKVNDDNILYYLYLNQDFEVNEMLEIINGKEIGNDGFLNKKTIYKVGGDK